MNHKQALKHNIFQIISQSAQELKLDCYVIGGFVRDYFLERGDAKDIDIVAIGSGIELANQVSKKITKSTKSSSF